MKILDIGCGQKKLEGSIGIDYSSMSDADYVVNLNSQRLPFEDGSVDYVHSSHCLEHLTLDGFFHTMREIYRVLKESGTLYIVVPYFQNVVNYANPFHNNKICFNEHTFRFFSSDETTVALNKEDYAIESCPQWGLRYSENSEIGIEFKTTRIKYYYSQEYRYRSTDELRKLRREKSGVVDQISYLLQPVKPCPNRPYTAPIGKGGEEEFIQEQLLFQREQFDHIQDHLGEYLSSDIFREACSGDARLKDSFSKFRAGFLSVEGSGGLFWFDGVLLPGSEVCHLVNEFTQQLRYLIDTCVRDINR